MLNKVSQEQEAIAHQLGVTWEEAVEWFDGKSVEQIKAELIRVWPGEDDNATFADRIHSCLRQSARLRDAADLPAAPGSDVSMNVPFARKMTGKRLEMIRRYSVQRVETLGPTPPIPAIDFARRDVLVGLADEIAAGRLSADGMWFRLVEEDGRGIPPPPLLRVVSTVDVEVFAEVFYDYSL